MKTGGATCLAIGFLVIAQAGAAWSAPDKKTTALFMGDWLQKHGRCEFRDGTKWSYHKINVSDAAIDIRTYQTNSRGSYLNGYQGEFSRLNPDKVMVSKKYSNGSCVVITAYRSGRVKCFRNQQRTGAWYDIQLLTVVLHKADAHRFFRALRHIIKINGGRSVPKGLFK